MSNTTLIPVKVPLKGTAYVWLYKKLQLDKRHYIVNNSDAAGALLIAAMVTNGKNASLKEYIKNYPHSLEFYFTDTLFFRKGKSFANEIAVREFNSHIDQLFKDEFMTYMNIAYTHTGKLHNSIYAFLAKYDPEEKYVKFDALKKYWQRHQNKINLVPKVPQNLQLSLF
jgi:hypothetical protein